MMRFPLIAVLSILLVSFCFARNSPAAPVAAPTTAPASADIEAAIEKGVKFILSQQNADGSFGQIDPRSGDRGMGPDQQNPGRTALAVMALLAAGESRQSPEIQKAVEYLKTARLTTTYSVALRACAYSLMTDHLRTTELPKDLKWLLTAAWNDRVLGGLYSYKTAKVSSNIDLSNSQYGVLGVWYAAESGADVPASYWKKVEEGWITMQHDDGGWSYMPEDGAPSYMTMSCGGVATLFITQDYLHWPEASSLAAAARKNEAIEKGLKWVADHFAVDENVGLRGAKKAAGVPAAWEHYMLFGYERVGEASGLTRFGKHPWFAKGARRLLATQQKDGSWLSSIGFTEDTSYALLFLARGRSPVAFQKLKYPGRWNNRPRDVANITRWLRRQMERHLNWQIVDIDASPAELRESPVLYLSGDKPLPLESEQRQTLKTFIEEGGLLLCANDGPQDEFAQSIVEMATELFPGYRFRDLPQDHPVFNGLYAAKGLATPVRAVSNGVRELIVIVPQGDLSWQLQSLQAGKSTVKPMAGLVGNVYVHAIDKGSPPRKGESHWIERDPDTTTGRSISLARLHHDGNWDPEPGGWKRVANLLANSDKVELKVESLFLGTDVLRSDFTLAHITATESLKFSPEHDASLKAYLDNGGFVLFDAAGGNAEVADSFGKILLTACPSARIETLPIDHSIYTGRNIGGQDLQSVTYRRYATGKLSSTTLPRLKGVFLKDNLIGLISAEDLSAGLTGYSRDGIVGYSPASATALVRNILLWRLMKTTPATMPATTQSATSQPATSQPATTQPVAE